MDPCQSSTLLLPVSNLLDALKLLNIHTSDKQLHNVSKDTIRQQLKDVGFDEQRQSEPVGGLSGGWKMKACAQ